MLALGGLFLSLDAVVDGEIYRRFDDSLSSRANAIAAYLGARVDRAQPIERWMPEFREEGHQDFFQAWDAQGQVVARSASAQSADLDRPTVLGLDGFTHYDLPLPDGHRGRAVARRYLLAADDPRQHLLLVVAEEREQIDALEQRLHLLTGGTVALALALAILLAWRGTNLGLKPLDQLAGRIAAVQLGDPGTAIADDTLPSELQPLARRFDEVIGTLLRNLARERRFALDLAHELRTPVAELRAITETTLLVDDPVQQRRALEELARLGSEMEQTVEALLSLARHEAGLVQAEVEPLDLAAILAAASRRLEALRVRRDVAFSMVLPAEYWVNADASMSARLVAILLGNAFEYAPEGSTVRLTLQPGVDGLRIENDAPDLAKADLEQLGTRFFRGGRASTGTGGIPHAGLGLALARALALAQGLELEFSLESGRLRTTVSGWAALENGAA
ncbi:MAG: HAMP domain-containing histidine kinase [Arenimonas sp.]|nr:HAMP domain-containing histidine kinase [Arenimonas sp.]